MQQQQYTDRMGRILYDVIESIQALKSLSELDDILHQTEHINLQIETLSDVGAELEEHVRRAIAERTLT